MRRKIQALFLSLALTLAAAAQKVEVSNNPNGVADTTKKSIKSVAEGKIGGGTFRVAYHSPGVRKRIIWGGLVPFDEVWVTGAHTATSLTFDRDVLINNKRVAAGTYAFFTIPGEKEWTVVLNRNYNQHLASEYDEKEDVVRATVSPQAAPHLERLQYFIEPGAGNRGSLAVAWEKLRIVLPLEVIR